MRQINVFMYSTSWLLWRECMERKYSSKTWRTQVHPVLFTSHFRYFMWHVTDLCNSFLQDLVTAITINNFKNDLDRVMKGFSVGVSHDNFKNTLCYWLPDDVLLVSISKALCLMLLKTECWTTWLFYYGSQYVLAPGSIGYWECENVLHLIFVEL